MRMKKWLMVGNWENAKGRKSKVEKENVNWLFKRNEGGKGWKNVSIRSSWKEALISKWCGVGYDKKLE